MRSPYPKTDPAHAGKGVPENLRSYRIICLMKVWGKKGSRVTAIVNRSAGAMIADESRREISGLIRGVYAGASVVFSDSGADAVESAGKALGQGCRMVVAGGGDGTISAIASVLAGTQAVLGVLPLGTLNHFAKDLGISDDLQEAVHTLAAGREVRVDVGEVNGRVFINNSGLGLYPAIVRLREKKQEQGASKRWAALTAALGSLARYRLLDVRTIANGREIIRKTPIVFVGNNEYIMEGLNMGTRPRLDAGKLSLVIPHAAGRLGLLWFTLRALVGRDRPAQDIDVLSARELLIRAGHGIVQVTLDGEVVTMETPLSYRMRPGALRVMAPLPGQ